MLQCIEKVAAIACGLVVGDTGAAVVGTAGLIGIYGEGRTKHGLESSAYLSKVRRRVLEELSDKSSWLNVDSDIFDKWDWSLGEVLLKCIPDRQTLANSLFDRRGFIVSATELILANIVHNEPIFLHPPAQLFAKKVVSAALTAAYDEKPYFDHLVPNLWAELGQKVGNAHDNVAELRADIEEVLAALRRAEIFHQSASQDAVMRFVERLAGDGAPKFDQPESLERWINTAQEKLARHSNEGEAFEAAHREAERRFREGLTASASEPFMILLQQEKAEAQRKQLAALDSAIDFDLLGMEMGEAIKKLKLVRDICPSDDADTLAAKFIEFANRYAREGSETGNNAALGFAIEAHRLALDQQPRDRVPCDWAGTQINLGNTLLALGERQVGNTQLIEAVGAYRLALQVFARVGEPLVWAMAQHNLGTALRALGSREAGIGRLEEAVSTLRLALEERTRQRVPLDWAKTQNNLGHALQTLAERDIETAHLEEAISAFHSALEEWPRETMPFEWATAQNNLGIVLAMLGERVCETKHLEGAASAYRLALQEWTRNRVPLQWAKTQVNLGNALQRLGKRETGTTHLYEAASTFRLALEEWTRERVPLDWAIAQVNLGNTLVALGEREAGEARLYEAAAAYSSAMEELTLEDQPRLWDVACDGLAKADSMIEERRRR